MRTSSVIALVLVLVASNAWWAYNTLDCGIATTYREHAFDDHRKALIQSLAVLPVAARVDSTPEEVVEAARSAIDSAEPFEKDGFMWVGRVGFRFSPSRRVVEAAPAWDPF